MKTRTVVAAMIAIASLSWMVYAQQAEPKKNDPAVPAAPVAPAAKERVMRRPDAVRRTPPGVEGADRATPERLFEMQAKQMEESIARRKTEAQPEIDELKAVLKLAEAEKATKTAEAVKKIIERKEAALAGEIKMLQERQQRMQEQLKKRAEEMEKNKAEGGAAAKEGTTAAPAKKPETPKQTPKPAPEPKPAPGPGKNK